MRARDLVQETNRSLLAKKGRSFLTVLGIAIGIIAVVIMVSLITGFENYLEDSMGLGAAKVVTIESNDNKYPLDTDDVTFVQDSVGAFSKAIPAASTTEDVASQNSDSTDDITLSIMGVDSEYFDLEAVDLEHGTVYSNDTDENVIVLSQGAVESIYGDEDYNVVGQTITIADENYTIVGITESSSGMSSMFASAVAYMPYQACCTKLIGDTQVDSIYALTKDDVDVSYAAAQVEGALAARHGVDLDEDNNQSVFSASTMEAVQESMSTFTSAFGALTVLVAGIALLVGGIGIMNMMLTNVTERYREIGLRKSLGARPRDITIQFLTESVALCVAGGISGAVVGYAGAWGIVLVIARLNSDYASLAPVVTPQLILLVFAICAGIGLIFGIYPAHKASKLNPAETLSRQ